MVNPRRVPWSSERELRELYGLIWDDFTDANARTQAVARLSIYVASPSAPVAFILLHSLLSLTLLPYPPTSAQARLASRQAHALALIRFTNGLVDPLQMGAHARPMSLLARQIGLPAGLVGLRHEATHEDLPSLEVLRDGVWKALEYLRVEAFEPLIFSENGDMAGTSRSTARRAELEQRLTATFRKYKKVMKSYFRERTSKSVGSGGKELRVVLRDAEETLEKALAEEEADVVMDVLTDCLLKPGCLIPLSVRKRTRPNHSSPSDIPSLDAASIRIWNPILSVLANISQREADNGGNESEDEPADILGETLARKCLQISMKPLQFAATKSSEPIVNTEMDEDFMVIDAVDLNQPNYEDGQATAALEEETYRFAVNIWLVALWTSGIEAVGDTKRKGAEDMNTDLSITNRCRKELGRELVEAIMEPLFTRSQADRPGSTKSLFDGLRNVDPTFASKTEHIKPRQDQMSIPPAEEPMQSMDNPLDEMEARLREMRNSQNKTQAAGRVTKDKMDVAGTQAARGWKLADSATWRPTPIGIFHESRTKATARA